MSMPFTHPSRSTLLRWLSSLSPSERITDHVESCERCASRLVELDGGETVDPGASSDEAMLAQAVRAEWAPPADLAERVIREIDEREHTRRDLSVVLDLFGIATETASLMLPPESTSSRETPALDSADLAPEDEGPSE